MKMLKNISVVCVCFLMLSSLAGCQKKVEEKPVGFGENREVIETSASEGESTKQDEFNVSDQNIPGYEITKSSQEIQEEKESQIEEEIAKIDETRDVEEESKEALVTDVKNPDTGETCSLFEIENPTVVQLVDDIISGEVTSEEEIKSALSKTSYSDEDKEELAQSCDVLLAYWIEKNKELDADPIDPRIVAENEDWKYYTQTEYDEFQKNAAKMIEEAGGAEKLEKHTMELN